MSKLVLNALTFAILQLFLFSNSVAMADAGGSCHFHGRKEANEETIIRCAAHHRNRLAKKGTIDSLWTSLNHETLDKVTSPKGKPEWRIVYAHPAATDESKKKLFMFFP
ncbi:MAG: hypothetical protein FJY29_13075 [Betaproteobacteria bacterium]|nr:hypothetical protein [Betaproteobacteria bacterium]